MINCAHPDHFRSVLEKGANNIGRLKGIRANASCKSHAELDVCDTLDAGDRHQLAEDYRALERLLPDFKVIGGCCGTDHTHLEEICSTLFGQLAF
jgi:homocysteine S-methyltransferase